MGLFSSITSAISDPGKLVSEVADAILPSNMKGIGEAIGGIVDLNTGHPLQALSHLSDALKDLPQLLGQSGAQTKAAATPAGTAAAEPSPPPSRTSTATASASTPTTASTPAASSTPATVTTPATSSTPAATAAPAAPSPSAQSPTVTVTRSGGESITKVDDGTNSTSITELNGRTNVTVKSDATGALLSSSSGTWNSISTGGGQGPHVTVTNKNGEMIATVDNGTSTTTVDTKDGLSRISVGRDIRGGLTALFSTLLHQNASTGTSGGAASTTANAAPVAPAGYHPAPATPAASGTAVAAAPAVASGAGPAPAASSTTANAASPASSSSSGATSASSSASSSSATPADLQSLMAMSPDQFMQAVTSGKIPADVGNSQTAMMEVQARMNSITQMNQLVTSMMSAMHQMQMSIIQNIRC